MLDERHLSLIEADRHRLVRAATRLLGAAEAEDAVQDAYLRALEADALELNAAQAWLLTVVRNLAIDRLRRRSWLQQWLAEAAAQPAATGQAPSPETDAALAEEAGRALRRLAGRLDPADGAAVLLREVFEASHAEIAKASGKTEAACRQQLRRALMRLRDGNRDEDEASERTGRDGDREAVFHLYLQSLQARQPQALFAMLRPAARAAGDGALRAAAGCAVGARRTRGARAFAGRRTRYWNRNVLVLSPWIWTCFNVHAAGATAPLSPSTTIAPL